LDNDTANLPDDQTLFDFDFETLNKKSLNTTFSSAILKPTKFLSIETEPDTNNKDRDNNDSSILPSLKKRLFSASTNHLFSSNKDGATNRSRSKQKSFSIKKHVNNNTVQDFKLDKIFQIGNFNINTSTDSSKINLKKVYSFNKINKDIKISSDSFVGFGSQKKFDTKGSNLYETIKLSKTINHQGFRIMGNSLTRGLKDGSLNGNSMLSKSTTSLNDNNVKEMKKSLYVKFYNQNKHKTEV